MMTGLAALLPLVASAADLTSLRPAAQWLRTERLRGVLFHRATIVPLERKQVQPLTPNRQSEGPASVVLRGWHHLVVLVDESGELRFSVRNLDHSEHFEQALYAVFSPEGNELEAGLVPPRHAARVALKGLAPGPYLVLLNSGPASSNTAEIRVRNAHWGVDAASRAQYEATPLKYHFLRDLKLGGFTLAMVDFEGLPESFATDNGLRSWTRRAKAWADCAAKAKLRIMPVVNLGGSPWEVEMWKRLPTGLFLDHVEGIPLAPCPMRREYWEALYLRRGREVAKMARHNPYVVGLGLDPELYEAHIYGPYTQSGTCFCDDCLRGFLRHRHRDETVLRQKTTGRERFEWLSAQGLLQAYSDRQEERMMELAAWCRDELHKIAPNLLLCAYLLDMGTWFRMDVTNWFTRGLARGLSEPDLPAINFCEHTYYSIGYDREVLDGFHGEFRDWGANVLQGSALWDLHFPPTKPGFLAAHAYNLAVNDEGWWFWPGDDLHREWGATHAYLNRPAYAEDYWQACVWANREIEQTMAHPGRASPLATAEVVPWKGQIEDATVKAPPELVRAQEEPAFPVCVAAPVELWFAVPEGAHEFTLTAQARGGDNAATVVVRDPSGREAGRLSGQLDAPEQLKVAITHAGVWSLSVLPSAGQPLTGLGLRFDGLETLLSPSPADCLETVTDKAK